MHNSLSIDATEYASVAAPPNRLVRGYSLVSASVFTILSITMLILASLLR
jgi:hypothetical protein